MSIATEASRDVLPGGGFLLEDHPVEELLTPDELSEEHRMIAETAKRFMLDRVMPNVEKLENKEHHLLKDLLREAAELGLVGAEIPGDYGGLELDLLSSMQIVGEISRYASWSVTFGGHTGIGLYPVMYFGTEAQKAKYIPMMATAEKVSSYALTEAGSGSDALAAKTTATLSDDGKHYILNGNKMWITNGGIADLAMVFAKVDGDKFTCFVVETDTPGFQASAEEKKMGLNGSSTTALVLDNVKVPVENLVGEIGKGHKIALNVLNIGRFKLGAGTISGAKFALADALKYSKERSQFGSNICNFGAIKQKLGQMVSKIFIGDSMNYRTGGLIEKALAKVEATDTKAKLKAIEEYAAECAIVKVLGSEYLDFVVDEMVQIYGGYGYSKEYPAELAYRDSRINRIFEGTNEINRLTITGMLLKRAMAGRLPLMDKLMEIQTELATGEGQGQPEGPLGKEKALLDASKKATLLCAGLAINAVGFDQPEQKHQEVLMKVADLVMEVFAQDSGWMRCMKLIQKKGEAANSLQVDALRVFMYGSVNRVRNHCRDLLGDVVSEPEELTGHVDTIEAMLSHYPINTVEPLRRLADRALELGKFPL